MGPVWRASPEGGVATQAAGAARRAACSGQAASLVIFLYCCSSTAGPPSSGPCPTGCWGAVEAATNQKETINLRSICGEAEINGETLLI